MDVTPLVKEGSQIIQSYSAGSFRVSGAVYDHPIMVFPDRVEKWTFDGDPQNLKPDDFNQIISYAPELDVVLFGGGKSLQFLNPELRRHFSDSGLVVESMDSGAACRTYNVLLAEGRRVAALLLPV